VSWPAAVAGLGPRVVGPYAACWDCLGDPPPPVSARVAGQTFTAPGPRHTFVRYGHTALCADHAGQRATPSSLLADIVAAFDGVVVERRPR
jgi:hypothetical protein